MRENPSEREIRIAAAHQKILTMKQDGLIKVFKGVTSFEELERVVDVGEDIEVERKPEPEIPPYQSGDYNNSTYIDQQAPMQQPIQQSEIDSVNTKTTDQTLATPAV